jgi:hypothetical protein
MIALVALLIVSLAHVAAAEDLYALTFSSENGKVSLVGKELISGTAPQYAGDAQYSVLDASGTQVGQGPLSVPEGAVMERFSSDGTIDGEVAPVQFTVIVPAAAGAQEVVLRDAGGIEIARTDVADIESAGMTVDELDSVAFFTQYAWLMLALLIVAALAGIVVGIVIWRKRRAKKLKNG